MTIPDGLRAVFFDLDDTILDDDGSVDASWQTACREASDRTNGKVDASRLFAAIATTRDWYWGDSDRARSGRADLRAASSWIVSEALHSIGRTDAYLAAQIANYYRDLREKAIAPFPGAIAMLQRLHSAGIALALITNGAAAAQRQKIERYALAQYFDFICIEGEFGCGKPDERVYRAALGALSLTPRATWMVGDNLEWDVAAPMALGISAVWVDRDGTGLPEGSTLQPHRIVRSISELQWV